MIVNVRVTNGSVFHPGEPIEITCDWNCPQPGKAIEIRLLWYTEGRTSGDVGVAETQSVRDPQPIGSRDFRFVAPGQPYSFAGTVFTLKWAVEAAIPGQASARADIIISPTGAPVHAA